MQSERISDMLPKQEWNPSGYEKKYIFIRKDDRIFCFRMERDIVTEIDIEDQDGQKDLNSIYVGKIRSITKNLNAAFVEYDKGKMAFLDLTGVDSAKILNRQNAVTPAQGDELLIQIVKEPQKTKDAVASTNLTLSGTFVVVSSERRTLNFSKQLSKDFCRELKQYIIGRQKEQNTSDKSSVSKTRADQQIKGNDAFRFGAIIRTNAGTLTTDRFDVITNELTLLQNRLSELIEKGKTRSVFTCLYQEHSFVENKCKDIPIEATDMVITDDAAIYEQLKGVSHLPIRFYTDDKISLFQLLGLGKVLKEAFSRKVWLPCGGYLVIDVTEALTVIDVNSGKCVSKKKKDDLVSLINLQAAEEAIHQIRLRNLSGIILIDFMKYEDPEMERQLIRHMRALAAKDKVQTDVVDMTALGLLEMTRKKISKPLHEKYVI